MQVFTGADGCWTNQNGSPDFAFDVYGSQRQPNGVDFARAYQDIVYSCIGLIADKMAEYPPKLYLPKGGSNKKVKTARTKSAEAIGQDVEEVVEGDLIDLLAKPNERHSWEQILWIWEQQRHLFGAGYLQKANSIIAEGNRPPSEIWILPSQNTYPQLDTTNNTKIQFYRSGSKQIAPNSIIEISFVDPNNIYGGRHSPVKACWSMLTMKLKHESYLANAYDNNGVPCAVAEQTDDQDMGEDAERTLHLDYNEWQTRRKNSGLLVQPKNVKFTFPAPPPKEIVGKSDELTIIKNAVASAFRIPYGMIEVAIGNRATLDASLTQFMMFALLPRIRERDAQLTKHLARLYDERMFFRTDSPLPADDDKKNAQFDLLGRMGAVTKNEIRAAYPELKLDQRPEFDESPTAPPRPSPTTVTFDDAIPGLGQIEDEALQAQASASRAEQSTQVLAIQSAVFAGGLPRDAGVAQLTTLFGFSIEQANALLPLVEKPEPAPAPVKSKSKKKKPPVGEEQLALIVKRFFEKQRDEVLGSITGESTKANKVQVGFDLAKANVELYSEAYPVINMMAEQQIKRTLIKVGADVSDYTVISHKLQPTIRKMVLEFADSTNRTTQLDIDEAYKRVKESISEGTENANDLESIRKEIAGIYSTATDSRTFMIANSETARAFAVSDQHAAVESGVVRGKTFLVSANACDICQKVAGKYRDKVMPVDHEWFDNPYSKGLLGHPNCKCSQLWILKEEYDG